MLILTILCHHDCDLQYGVGTSHQLSKNPCSHPLVIISPGNTLSIVFIDRLTKNSILLQHLCLGQNREEKRGREEGRVEER